MAKSSHIYGVDGFKFKMLNENDVQKAINKVRRERLRMKDEEVWNDFCFRERQKNRSQHLYKLQSEEILKDASNHSNDEIQTKFDNDDIKNYLYAYSQMNDEKTCYDELLLDIKNNSSDDIQDGRMDKKKSLAYSGVTSFTVPRLESKDNSKYDLIKEKLYSIMIKIRHVLEIIESHIYDFCIPDNPAEIIKLEKKATEFCVRFSRNYLYQIELQFSTILNVNHNLCLKNTFGKERKYDFILIVLKLYQDLFQAFLMIQRHMHIIWGYSGIAEKLNKLLQYTVKINNICSSLVDITDTSFWRALENACEQLTKSTKFLIEVKHPLSNIEKATKNKRILSSYSLTSMNTNASVKKNKDPRNKTTPNSKRSFSSNNPKRNINSASSHNQYSMYESKPFNRTNAYCKYCNEEFKTINKSSANNASSQRKRVINQNKLGQAVYHKNCHGGIATVSQKKERTQCTKQNAPIKTSADKQPNKFKSKPLEKDDAKVTIYHSNNIPENRKLSIVANHFSIANNKAKNSKRHEDIIKKKVSKANTDDKKIECDNKSLDRNVKMVIVSHKSDKKDLNATPNHSSPLSLHDNINDKKESLTKGYFSDSEVEISKKRTSLSGLKHFESQNNTPDIKSHKTAPKLSSKIQYDKINRISDNLISNELSAITSEMEMPLEQFIKNEVKDFSDFLYRTHATKKQT